MAMLRAILVAVSLASAASLQVDFSDTQSPIQRVVGLLKEMQTQLDTEADEDADMQEKMGCWCHTNDKEKTHANAVNTQRVADLGAAIEEYTAKSAQLKVDLESLGKQVADQTNSLETATSLREKEAGEFHSTEKDAIANLGSINGAVMTLGKTHGESLMEVKQILRHHIDAHKKMLSSSQHRMVLSLLQQPDDSALLQAPQSGAIFGIMKQMKESMETNLKTSQTEEGSALEQFGQMKAAKTDEINSANELIDSKTVELAQTDESNAQSKQDLEDTSNTLAADTDFLANLKSKCANSDSEYEARRKVRTDEIMAVTETINIVTSDDAKDLLNKQSFIQLSSHRVRLSRTERAARVVQDAAKRLRKPRLNALAVSMAAVSMRADVFGKVKQNIDAMVAGLKKTQSDEVAQRDFCIKEFHSNELQTADANHQKEDLTQQIADLETSAGELNDAIAQLNVDLQDTQVELKKASENREKANKEFMTTVTDQRATRAILNKAVNRLKDFYSKKGFLQVRSTAAVTAPYKKSGGASGVMSMIQAIIQESADLEKDAVEAENQAQTDYASFVTDSNNAIESMNKGITNKQEELAKADMAKAKAAGDLRATEEDIARLAEYATNLHSQCDFLTKFFDVRQQSRAQEIEALQQAKAIFSGANMGL